MTYSFTFHILPQPKERPRFAKRGNFVQTYTAPKTKSFEHEIAVMARAQMAGRTILNGLLMVRVTFQFKRPKRTKLLTPKKDLDNLCKSVCDAANGVIYIDDTQIVYLEAKKLWGDEDLITMEVTQ